ncbi:MAG: MaoC/PaaZ C-terminal domain-containing protein [Myxococcota bacterium]|jgi:acyl dehydratase|nr:MaoC/PaaZ C-terminal domain-containing protein [Myxococcota bacterium]
MSTETLRYQDVNVGDTLPELPIPLTSSLIVAGAVASQDYTPVHHDKEAAEAAGMQDVFMNILTTNGLVSRFVTDWAGIDARITGVSIKLGTPNLPGDTMTLTGAVAEKDETGNAVTVEVTGKNAWGNHVTGAVKLTLPAGD